MSGNKPLVCPKHGIERTWKNDSGMVNGGSLQCRECLRERQREYWNTTYGVKHNAKRRAKAAASKDYHRKLNLKRNYGLSLEEYNQMFAEQNGKCAVCGEPEVATNQFGIKQLAVDHSHASGRIRGLLCSDCNLMIGKAKDNTRILRTAIEYIETS